MVGLLGCGPGFGAGFFGAGFFGAGFFGAGFFGAGFVGMLLLAVVWIGLMVALIWGVGCLFPRERRADYDVACEVVGRRYAAGEISEAEYRPAIRTLRADEHGRVRMRRLYGANTLQHAATRCNTLQHHATQCHTRRRNAHALQTQGTEHTCAR